LESEELLLRNTFLNAQMGPIAQLHIPRSGIIEPQNARLKWVDE
jgi:hypothetical protein